MALYFCTLNSVICKSIMKYWSNVRALCHRVEGTIYTKFLQSQLITETVYFGLQVPEL